MLYAIDSDDVLFVLNNPLQEYKVELDRSMGIVDTKVLTTEEIFDYNLGKVWGCSLDLAFEVIDGFFNSEYFDMMQPIPGAQEAIAKLKQSGHELVILTSRPSWVEQKTIGQIDKHYSGKFKDVLFSGEWSKTPNGNSKGVICNDLGVDCLVDDRFKYCNDASKFGIESYLFDLGGKYGWNKKNGDPLPPKIKRVLSWAEILEEK